METQDIRIKKVKLSKGGCVEASYTDADGNEITLKGKNKCHNDLRVALAALVPYFADLTEQKEADDIDWSNLESAGNVDLLRKLDVSGLSIGGDENNRIITMTGRRTLITSRVLNLNAPGVEMESETFEWGHIDDFDLAVQNVIYETKEYILNRKWEVLQTTMFDGDPDDPFAAVTPTDDAAPVEQPDENVA
jgi:hypothetical protein|nr:MAG TPA: hypothetical protein [Caudoviricetes sp.]